MDEDEVNAYAAGFDFGYLSAAIDGEGNIGISKRYTYIGSPSYSFNAIIANTNLYFLERLKLICSGVGTIIPIDSSDDEYSRNRRDGYHYRIPAKFFRKIMPCLDFTVKECHLDVVERFFEIQDSSIGRWHTKEELEELEQLYITMKELNKRGKL